MWKRLLTYLVLFIPVFAHAGTDRVHDWWGLSKRQILQKIKGVHGTDVDDPFYALFQWAQDIDESYPGTGIYYVSNFNSIQAAIDSAHAHGGGKVVLECDTVTVTSSIVLYSNIWLSGVGPCSVIKTEKSSTFDLSAIKIDGGSNNVFVSDLKIEPDTTSVYATEYDHAVRVDTASNVRIFRVVVPQCVGDGVYIRDSDYISVTNCYFSGQDISSPYDPPCPRNGISVVGGNDIVIYGNTFYGAFDPGAIDIEPNAGQIVKRVIVANNTIKGIDLTHLSNGVSIYANADSANSLVRDVLIYGNVMSRVYGRAINIYDYYSNAYNVSVVGNSIDSCGLGASPSSAVFVRGAPKALNLSGNTITNGTRGPAIYIYETNWKAIDGALVSDNVLDSVRYGVMIYRDATRPSPRLIRVHDNTIRNTVYDGINVQNTDGPIFLYGNTITGAGRYGISVSDADSVYSYGNAVFYSSSEDYRPAGTIGDNIVFNYNLGNGGTRYSNTVADMKAQQDTMKLSLRGQHDSKAFAITSDDSDSLLFVVNGYGVVKTYNRAGVSSFAGRLTQWWFADVHAPQMEWYVNKDTLILYGNDTYGWAGWPYVKSGFFYGRFGLGVYPGIKIYLDDEWDATSSTTKDSYIWYNTSTSQVEIVDDGVTVFPTSSSISGTALDQTLSLGSYVPYLGTTNGVYLQIPAGGTADVRLPAVNRVHNTTVKLDTVWVRVTYNGIATGSVDSINVWSISPAAGATWLGHALSVGEGTVAIDTGDYAMPENYTLSIRAYDSDTNWMLRSARLKYIW